MHQLAQENFNGISLFSTTTTATGGTAAIFNSTDAVDNTVSIYTTERGTAGSVVSINKSALLSSVTFNTSDQTTKVQYQGSSSTIKTLGVSLAANTINLSDISVSFFAQAIENVASLRAQNGGTTSRLQFALEHANRNKTNLEAANGRILDVDIAEESTRLAKYNILVQASAAMLAQANTAPNAALMLLG